MPNSAPDLNAHTPIACAPKTDPWSTFEDMLSRLHAEGVYVHADQLAEFLLRHGLPVHLRHVPAPLIPRAQQINSHYQGDMAQLIEDKDWWHLG